MNIRNWNIGRRFEWKILVSITWVRSMLMVLYFPDIGAIRRNKNLVVLALVMVLYGLLPKASHGATTIYTNLADFQVAAGSLVTIDFATGDNGQPLAPLGTERSYGVGGLTVGGVHFSGKANYLIATNYGYQPPFLYGSNTLSPAGYLQASLPPGTTAIGVPIGSFVTYNPPPTFEVTLSTGETFTTGVGFFGVVSTVPFEWVRFRFASQVQAGYSFDTVVLWDFFYHMAPPQPVAVVGPDQSVNENSPVTLDGSASSGEFLSYQWPKSQAPQRA